MIYKVEKVPVEEKENALEIYESLKGSYGCTWDVHYPVMEDVSRDIQSGSLYGVFKDRELIAVAAAGKDDELAHLSCWDRSLQNACDLARVAVRADYQNQGIAKMLITGIEKNGMEREFDGIHLIVGKTNPYAIRLYDSLGYLCCGETSMYGNEWLCYQKKL
ncbi:GNAT family N-acetyltransferase [Caproiciproducens sp. R2]|uniref:GNAT family N-acetyltransferase n=1 Tax=Caproiciproducens sp. R2 TaxID=3435187 RepID=UPI004034C209